jgi:hypothetical protein
MRQWGYQQKNIDWRTFELGAANELLDTIDYSITLLFAPPTVVDALP